jgi:hypothetical protein
MVEGDLEAPGREELRSQINISEPRLITEAPRLIADQLLHGYQSLRDPFANPSSDLAVRPARPAQFVERTDIVKWMDVAFDNGRDAARLGALSGIGWKKRRLGDRLLKIFQNGRGLGQRRSIVLLEHGNPRLGIDGPERRQEMLASVAYQMYGNAFVGDAFESQTDTNALLSPDR